MLYNYRFDRSLLSEIYGRIQRDAELSQGWGGGTEENLDLNDDDFVQKCARHYQLATTRVASNLTRIRDFKRGDVLVVPHMPEHGKVSLHVVSDDFPACYRYEPNDDSHQNHRIRITKSYGLDGGLNVRHLSLMAWYGKLQWLRLPVLPIPQYEDAFIKIMEELEEDPGSRFEQTEFADYLSVLRGELIAQLKLKLQDIRPSGTNVSFEAICKSLLESSGYRIVSQNYYNSEGGDVDLHCIRDRSDVSPFEGGETNLFVQVKKHTGRTDEYSVKQVLGMMKDKSTAECCVMSLGDSFTDEAEKVARNNGVLLMSGDTICQLLLQDIGKIQDA